MEIESGRVEGLRVRVYTDEDPMPLGGQGDFLPLVVSVPKPNGHGAPVIEAGYVGDFDVTRLAWAATHYAIGNVREEPTARYLWLAYGVAVKLVETMADGDTWWVCATPEWVRSTLGPEPDVEAALEQSAQFVRDYCNREVYCYTVEYEAEWVHNGTGRTRTEWQPVESATSGDLVGYDYAVEEARRALAEAELEMPVAWPTRPPAHPLLWRCVAEPATLADFTVTGHQNEGDALWLYWLACGVNDPVEVEAARLWAALLACATGAVGNVEPGWALECRDLVTANWTGYVGWPGKKAVPLSPEAADAVFHVAVCGAPCR